VVRRLRNQQSGRCEEQEQKRKLTVWSCGLDDFALKISSTIYIGSGKNLDESADITSIYGLKPRLAFAKYGKHRQVASKLCESLPQNQRTLKWCQRSSH